MRDAGTNFSLLNEFHHFIYTLSTSQNVLHEQEQKTQLPLRQAQKSFGSLLGKHSMAHDITSASSTVCLTFSLLSSVGMEHQYRFESPFMCYKYSSIVCAFIEWMCILRCWAYSERFVGKGIAGIALNSGKASFKCPGHIAVA